MILKTIILIITTITLSACNTMYKIPQGNDLAIIHLVMPDKVINNLSLYRYRQTTGNLIDVFLDKNNKEFKPRLFPITANRKIRLYFNYDINFFDYCQKYMEFNAKVNHVYTIIITINPAKYHDVPFVLTHDCEFTINES